MGITNLKKFIKGGFKTSPVKSSLIKQINISEFSGERIATDISSYLYKYKIVFGDKWLDCFPTFITTFKQANVHNTLIFDGKPPIEKEAESKRRRDLSDNLEDKIVNLSFDLDIYKDTNEISDLLKETMKKITEKDEKMKKVTNLLHAGKKNSEAYIDVEAVEAFIKKKEGQNIRITQEDTDTLKELLDRFGVPWIQAPSEAEALAAYLYSIGEVKAVLTEDTDILVYGVNIYLSGFNSVTGNCEAIYLNEVLEEIEYTFEQFVDFCIMCGSDYGNNIKGVGTATAYKHIEKHKSIEKYIESSSVDPSVLNYVVSRDLFKTYGRIIDPSGKSSGEYKARYWETMIDIEKLFDYLYSKKCKYSPVNIKDAWSPPEIEFED